MTEQIKEVEFICSQCHNPVPASGWNYRVTAVIDKNGVTQHKAGSRMMPCKQCKASYRVTWLARTKATRDHKAGKPPPDLSWNSLLGVAVIK